MENNSDEPIAGKGVRTAIVGSYPKPRYIYNQPRHHLLLDAGSFYDLQRQIGPDRFKKRLDRAALMAVKDQQKAGIDYYSDGEERRDHYIW